MQRNGGCQIPLKTIVHTIFYLPAVDFKPSIDEQFVRVFKEGSNNPQGAFVMKQSDVTGLTPAQIKDKFTLDNIQLS